MIRKRSRIIRHPSEKRLVRRKPKVMALLGSKVTDKGKKRAPMEYEEIVIGAPTRPKPIPVKLKPKPVFGGGGWAVIRKPQTGKEGWIQYGIGTQYRYGGKAWDEKYKGWKVIKSGRDIKPPKGALLLPSGYTKK